MNADTYMKAVLTVIAVCLVWICVRDVTLVKPAQAAGPMDVNIVNSDSHALQFAGPIRMIVTNSP